MTYWIDLFTLTSWNEFLAAGGNISGFNEKRWATVQKLAIGDVLLCYLTGVKRFVGALEVISAPFRDETVIWSQGSFPCRVEVKALVQLTPENAVPIHDLLESLTIFEKTSPYSLSWTGHLRSSPTKWREGDGKTVLFALQQAKEIPVTRPLAIQRTKRLTNVFSTDTGSVTVPETEISETPIEAKAASNEEAPAESDHTVIQYLLLRLGMSMGYGIWVARNDVSRVYEGKKLSEHFPLKTSLPLQFDPTTLKTIELIDVLWLTDNAIVAAFEVESTTSIYSGLLRMSDLLTMQPNLDINLYIVAPDERRDKVMQEINRPTFARLRKPLPDLCRYISFPILKAEMKQAEKFLQHLKIGFLEALAEDCHLNGSLFE